MRPNHERLVRVEGLLCLLFDLGQQLLLLPQLSLKRRLGLSKRCFVDVVADVFDGLVFYFEDVYFLVFFKDQRFIDIRLCLGDSRGFGVVGFLAASEEVKGQCGLPDRTVTCDHISAKG